VKQLIGLKLPSHSKPKRNVGLKKENCFVQNAHMADSCCETPDWVQNAKSFKTKEERWFEKGELFQTSLSNPMSHKTVVQTVVKCSKTEKPNFACIENTAFLL